MKSRLTSSALFLGAVFVLGAVLSGCSLFGEEESDTTYTVTYMSAAGGGDVLASHEYREHQGFDIAEIDIIPMEYRPEGLVFRGWSSGINGTGLIFTPSEYVSAGSANWPSGVTKLTLYPIWAENYTDPIDPPDDNDDVVQKVDPFFWGSWVRMPSSGSNTDNWYISADRIKFTDAFYSDSLVSSGTQTSFEIVDDYNLGTCTVAKVTENLLKVGTGASAYNLVRKSGAMTKARIGVALRNETIQGSVRSARAATSLAGIKVILTNSKNTKDRHEIDGAATTDLTGEVDGLIAGDTYDVEVVSAADEEDVQAEAEVIPLFDNQDLGTVTVTDAASNFKVSYHIGSYWGDQTSSYIFGGQEFTLLVRITNTGTTPLQSGQYEFTPPAGLTMDGSLNQIALKDILGSIAANGGFREMMFKVTPPALSSEMEVFNIPLRIWSTKTSVEWNDTISLQVHQESMYIYIEAKDAYMNGLLITPDKKFLTFNTSSYTIGSVRVPKGRFPYTIGLSGASYDTQTKYYVALTNSSDKVWESYNDLTVNEPNDIDTQANPVFLDTMPNEGMGFLDVADVDFIKVYPVAKNESVLFETGTYEALALEADRTVLQTGTADSATIRLNNETLANSAEEISWRLDGNLLPGETGKTLFFAAQNAAVGTHTIAVKALYNGILYSASKKITVLRGNAIDDVIDFSTGVLPTTSGEIPVSFEGTWTVKNGRLQSGVLVPNAAGKPSTETILTINSPTPFTLSFDYGGVNPIGEMYCSASDGNSTLINTNALDPYFGTFTAHWVNGDTPLPAGTVRITFSNNDWRTEQNENRYYWVDNIRFCNDPEQWN